jgi:Fuc2NAc and GlcNAc transferase
MSMIRSSILFCTVFLVSMLVTGLVRRYALKVHLLDYPNERSSHVRATLRGGGVGLVFSSTAAALFLWATGSLRRTARWFEGEGKT